MIFLRDSLSQLAEPSKVFLRTYQSYGGQIAEVTDGWLKYNVDNNLHKFWENTRIQQIYSAEYSNANIRRSGTVSTNNGERSPVTKVNNGDAVIFIINNGLGNNYGGNWIVTVSISISSGAATISAPTQGQGEASYTINGYTYYVSYQATNASWGGGTTIGNPLGLPVLQNFFFCNPNENPSTAKIEEIIDLFDIYPRGNKIPQMTSNTSPRGTVSGSYFVGYENGVTYSDSQDYYAFNESSSNCVLIGTENTTGYIQYTFDNAITLKKIIVTACKISMYTARNESFTVEAYYGGSWHTFGTFTITEDNGLNYVWKDYSITGSATNVTAIRVKNNVQKNYGYNVAIAKIQAF